jgi:hypothetical protein
VVVGVARGVSCVARGVSCVARGCCRPTVFSVTDHQIRQAMRFALERLKIVLEPAAAVGLATLLDGQLADAVGACTHTHSTQSTGCCLECVQNDVHRDCDCVCVYGVCVCVCVWTVSMLIWDRSHTCATCVSLCFRIHQAHLHTVLPSKNGHTYVHICSFSHLRLVSIFFVAATWADAMYGGCDVLCVWGGGTWRCIAVCEGLRADGSPPEVGIVLCGGNVSVEHLLLHCESDADFHERQLVSVKLWIFFACVDQLCLTMRLALRVPYISVGGCS